MSDREQEKKWEKRMDGVKRECILSVVLVCTMTIMHSKENTGGIWHAICYTWKIIRIWHKISRCGWSG